MRRAWTRSPTPAYGALQAERHAVLVDPAEADQLGAQLARTAGRPARWCRPAAASGCPARVSASQAAGRGRLGLLARCRRRAAGRAGGSRAAPSSSPSRSRSDASRSQSCGEPAGLGQLVAGAGLRRAGPCRRRRRPRRAGGGRRPAAASPRRPRRGGGSRPGRRCRSSRTRRPRRGPRRAAATPRRRRPAARPAASRSWVASQRATLRAVRPSPVRTSVAIWRGGQPEHPPRRPARAASGSVQAAGERADDERLAGAGRADQRSRPARRR